MSHSLDNGEQRRSAAANSSLLSPRGKRCPYVSAVMTMVEWPRRCCTVLIGNSKPPSRRRLMLHEAKKCRKVWIPGYFGLFAASTTPASRDRSDRERKPRGEIVAMPGYQPHAGTISTRHDAKAVVLDLMQPIVAAWRLLSWVGQARFDEADCGAVTQTQHAGLNRN